MHALASVHGSPFQSVTLRTARPAATKIVARKSVISSPPIADIHATIMKRRRLGRTQRNVRWAPGWLRRVSVGPPRRGIMPGMTAWHEFEQAAPEFAQRVRTLFEAHRHKTIATLRADGAPRISGIEAAFEDGELVFGSMTNARKGADLRRDPRFALHSATVDPVEGAEAQWPGEAKISGRAVVAGAVAEGPEGERFRADVAEVVHTHLNEEASLLVVEWWTPAQGLRKVERE